MKRHGLLAILILGCAAAAAGFLASRAWYAGPAEGGATAADFRLTDLDGKVRTLSEWRGQLVLVNFWASWCAPCMNEIPLLVEAQRRYAARGLQILGPALDDAEAVRPLQARFAMNYPVMADFRGADAAMRELGNSNGALPYSVVIGRDGQVLTTVLGGLSRAELHEMIEAFLDDKPPPG